MKNITLSVLCFFISLQFVQLKANTVFMQNDTTINNTLTQEEANNGWQLLFDGKSLNGWKTFKNETGSWKAANDMLCSYSADAGNADLISNTMYENFELDIDWKISPEGNSGILYLVTENYDQTFLSGPEYQLIDDNGFPEKIENWQKTGADYAMYPPTVNAANKPGEWNTTKIIVNKEHVEHWLNGKKVVEYNLWSDYCASKTGHIALQSSHSNVKTSGICFRNIKIRSL